MRHTGTRKLRFVRSKPPTAPAADGLDLPRCCGGCKGRTAFDHIGTAMTVKTHRSAQLARVLAGGAAAPDYYG